MNLVNAVDSCELWWVLCSVNFGYVQMSAYEYTCGLSGYNSFGYLLWLPPHYAMFALSR